jgi:hypothetical protein
MRYVGFKEYASLVGLYSLHPIILDTFDKIKNTKESCEEFTKMPI